MRHRGLVPALALGALAAGLALLAAVRIDQALDWSRDHGRDDFGVVFDSATCFFDGGCEPYDLGSHRAPNLNAPHTHLLLRPLVGRSVDTAYGVWLAAGLASAVVAALRLVRAVPLRVSASTAAVLVAGLGASAIVSTTVRTGQMYALLTWPVTEAYLAVRAGRWRRAAGILGVLVTAKPLLGLPLLWVLWPDRRSVAVAVVAAGVTVLGGGALLGVDAYADWLEELSGAALAGHQWDASLLQYFSRTFEAFGTFPPMVDAPGLVRPLWAASAVVVLFDVRRRVQVLGPDRAWLLLVAAAMLVSPKGWVYMGWLLVPPALVVARQREWPWAFVAVGAALLLADSAPLDGQPNRLLVPLLGSLYFWCLVALHLEARRDRGTSEESSPQPAANLEASRSPGLE